MSTDLIDLVQNLGQPRVLVVGDLMLDRYVWGDAERISQEAPVILLHADKREERLGGASSVATMLRALGAQRHARWRRRRRCQWRTRPAKSARSRHRRRSCADRSRAAQHGQRALHRPRAASASAADDSRRLRGAQALSASREQELCHAIARQMRRADIVLISDYDKGVCTPGVLTATIATARALDLRTIVDPIRGKDYRKYHGCSAMTPNRLEAGLATGRLLNTPSEALDSAAQLREQLDMEAAIVTLDKEGMALVHRDSRRELFPTRPRTCTTSPAPVTWCCQCWAWHWRRARTTIRRFVWRMSPVAWKSRRSASPR